MATLLLRRFIRTDFWTSLTAQPSVAARPSSQERPRQQTSADFPYKRRAPVSRVQRSATPRSLRFDVYRPPTLDEIATLWRDDAATKVLMNATKASYIREAVAGDYAEHTLQIRPDALVGLDANTHALADSLMKVLNANATYKQRNKRKLAGLALQAATHGKLKRKDI